MGNFRFRRSRHLLGAFALAVALLPGPAGSPATGTPAPLPANLAWGWPLPGRPRVVNAFDPPAKPWLAGHRGVDLEAGQGAPVLAPANGVVTFSGTVVDRDVLTMAVAGGLRLSFEPVVSTLKAGDSVERGQELGRVEGITHCRDPAGAGSCLHWGVRRGDSYLDPLQFILDLRPSVLLPLINRPSAVVDGTQFRSVYQPLLRTGCREGKGIRRWRKSL